jgi:hypothetical protein
MLRLAAPRVTGGKTMAPLTDADLGDCRNAIARLLAAYDRLRRAAGGVPRREDFGLEQLRELLGWQFFADWTPPASIVVRLAGTYIDYVLGANVTGVDFFEKYRPEQRSLYARFYAAIADSPCGGYSVRRVVVAGTEAFDYHSIYLPLAPRPGHVPIIGAVAVTGFSRLVEAGAERAPDFQALARLGVFDIGFGPPAGDLAGDLECVDIAAVVGAIEAAGRLSLDRAAREARSLVSRPPTIG